MKGSKLKFLKLIIIVFIIVGPTLLAYFFPKKYPYFFILEAICFFSIIFIMSFMIPNNKIAWLSKKRIITFSAILSASLFSTVLIYFGAKYNSIEKNIKEIYQEKIQLVTNVVETSTNQISYNDSILNYDIKSYVVYSYTIDSLNNIPKDKTKPTLKNNWLYTLFGEDIIDEYIYKGKNINELPQFNCSYAFLVILNSEKSGRMINLDIGSVPEILWFSEIYLYKLETNFFIKLPCKIYGKQAKVPKLPAVNSYSYLVGDKPKWSKMIDCINLYVND